MPLHPCRPSAVLAASMLLSALTACGDEAAGPADCAAVLLHDGHSYLGRGDLERGPSVTGRSLPAVLPGCDDTREGPVAEKQQRVRVEELVDVAAETAVLFDGVLYVREGRALPGHTRRWFQVPRCSAAGTFELTGDWLGVTGPRPIRSDGDVRPPYRLEIRVRSGPARYVGTTVRVHVLPATDPALTPADVAGSLWRGGRVTASVRCSEGRFAAVSLRAR